MFQPGVLLQRLDAFRDHVNAKIITRLTNRPDDRLARSMPFYAAHDLHIQLDQIGLKIRQEVKPRISRAEIVYRDLQANAPVLVD